MMQRHAVVACARQFLGVRFQHQGRSREGLDCLGLLLATADVEGLRFEGNAVHTLDVPSCSVRPDTQFLRQKLDQFLVPILPAQLQPADIVLLNIAGFPQHLAILGNEIFQFSTATLIAPNIYRLSNLLRGRLGTEMHMASHVLGERFVLLNDAVVPYVVPASSNGQLLNLRASTFGTSLDTGTTASLTVQGNSLKPYSPVQLQAVRTSSGDISLQWKRRARIDGGMRDYVDIPLKEANENYEVKLYDGSTLKRSWRVSTPVALYATADQLADWGAAPTSLTFTVAQISSIVGLGHIAQATVPIKS